MLFLNEYEIDRAFAQFADGDVPVLAAAVKTLRNLRGAVNAQLRRLGVLERSRSRPPGSSRS
jgi:hypothetical protein